MIYYFVAAEQTHAMKSFLESWGKSLAGSIEIVTYQALLAGQQHVPGNAGAYIFNSLGMLRRTSPEVRSAIHALYDRLVNACGPAKVLNNPKTALPRFELLRTLHDRGINSFNVYRLNETPRRFPVFIRQESGTEYSQPPLRRSAEEYQATVRGVKWMRGSLFDMVALEFCDTADANGIYRKYGAFVVGDRIVPRHVFFSRDWMVKLADLSEPAMIEEELAFLDSHDHADLLRQCARLANMSYGRIDYSLLDGRPQIWEINANPMLASSISAVIPARRDAHLKFVTKISEAFAALDGRA